MARGNIPITKRSDLAVPISPVQNDDNLDSLRAGILNSTEAPSAAFPFGVASDVAGAAVADDPDFFDVRGSYCQTKVPADIGLPAEVTDMLVLVVTQKLRLNADDGAALQQAFSSVAGVYQRIGTNAGWGAWVSLVTANLTSTELRRGLIELATQLEVNAGADAVRAVTPATLAAVLASGGLIGAATAQFTNVDSTALVIPTDGTRPQIGEGKEFGTLVYTPKFASSKLRIRAAIPVVSIQSAAPMSIALFRDAGVDAIAAAMAQSLVNGDISSVQLATPMMLEVVVNAVAAVATTFRLRFGPNGGTMFMNGKLGGGSPFGISTVATLSVEELKA